VQIQDWSTWNCLIKCILQICLIFFLIIQNSFLTVLFFSSVSDVGLVVVAFEAVGCCISMGDVGVRLLSCFVGMVWYQMVSHSDCWMVLSDKISLLYLFLCFKWTDKPSVTGSLSTHVLSCCLRCFAVLVAKNLLQRGCMCFVLNI